MSKSDDDAKKCNCTGGFEGAKCFECFSSRHERCSKGCVLSNYTKPKTLLEQMADDVGELETSVLAQAVPRKMTKEERRAAMYTSYNNPDESFGRCGHCHKPLMTCMCDPDDLDDYEDDP